jgi:methionyl-tRNA synthetase
LETQTQTAISEYEHAMDHFVFQNAMKAVWVFVNQLNKYVDVTAPWELAKKKSTRKQLQVVLHNLLEGLGVISGLIYPVMPDTAATMQRHLNIEIESDLLGLKDIKSKKLIRSGVELPKSITLFPRIDLEKVKKAASEYGRIDKPAIDLKPEITMEEFSKVDLRVATVIRAETIPRAKKLLKLEVDLGEKRTIVAGIAEKYKPEELIGKQIIIVANLKSAKLMGVVSNGMLLAAMETKRFALATLDKETTPGTPLS